MLAKIRLLAKPGLTREATALTECFLSTAPIPLRGLRDLRAMLSFIA